MTDWKLTRMLPLNGIVCSRWRPASARPTDGSLIRSLSTREGVTHHSFAPTVTFFPDWYRLRPTQGSIREVK